ncbi:Interferon-inducible GTPase 1 [Fukomys damarensis]|uniref:Interferon-inducible GTPase 1 n=2 Tax=Fukomys damarensis TaxID=885580 RepID=A0A091DNF7_FUKDA|nr:Interferon-inducible GTPase 1 [Fukomys damarensis]
MSQLYSKTPNVEEHLHLLSSFKYFKNSSTENKVISQETISAIELHLTEGDILGANSVITAALKEIDNTPLNIAVTGESGTGKSSFINALRGVGHESKEAAPIGVCETTMEKKLYCHPAFPNVRVWDLPGIGTINFQPKDYLKQVQFVEYDFFIIVSSTRFKQNDIDLANVITIMKKNFYFVRTKVDSDLRNEKKCKPSTFNEETVLQTIQNNCLANFKKSNMIEPQIFLISNNNASKFDFPILMDTLINDVPVQKRHIFMLSLPNITEAVTERKWKSLKQHIWLKAFKAGLLATLPLQGIISIKDKEKLKTSLNYFRVLFGVDDLSLKSLAKDLQVPVEQLKAIIKSPNLLEIDNEETIEEKLWRYVETFCLINGGLLATGIYFKKSFCLQLHFLDTVSEDAKVIFRKSYSRQN